MISLWLTPESLSPRNPVPDTGSSSKLPKDPALNAGLRFKDIRVHLWFFQTVIARSDSDEAIQIVFNWIATHLSGARDDEYLPNSSCPPWLKNK